MQCWDKARSGDENARAKPKQARKFALEVLRCGEACVDASLANPALPYIRLMESFLSMWKQGKNGRGPRGLRRLILSFAMSSVESLVIERGCWWIFSCRGIAHH